MIIIVWSSERVRLYAATIRAVEPNYKAIYHDRDHFTLFAETKLGQCDQLRPTVVM